MKLSDIKGLGSKRIEKLASSGIYDPLDLLMCFPAKYYDRRKTVDWAVVSDGEEVIFKGILLGRPVFKRIRKGLSFVKAQFRSGNSTVTCTWFNQDYVFRRLLLNGICVICGKIKRFRNSVEITAPQILQERDVDILPIYRLPKGLTQTLMTDAVSTILQHLRVKGFIDKPLADKYGLLPLNEAFRRIHFPVDIPDAEIARKSIALENLAYTLGIYNLSKDSEGRVRHYRAAERELQAAIDLLPFALTDDQAHAVKEIVTELHSPHRLNALLQGDVGSGKTVVAFLAMYYASLSGFQSAIMAPTEILAGQHYKAACAFFAPLGKTVRLLTGSTGKERKKILEDIANGTADIVVGTHAILGEGVMFANLGLTVTDEQHRFGVCQRGSLENKTAGADHIVMSATPIPRTLALTLYGQLKTVILHSRPSGKNRTMTAIVPNKKIKNLYEYIKNKAESGERAYIVCPRVDSEETTSVLSLYDELSHGPLASVGIGMLHGRQKESEKNAVMSAFASGEIKVLVSTTVIEVGIDVKEASTMVIYNADYFGLSQLHQLRGRVGRDGRESYCFLVGEDIASERIRFFCECADGFRLAEYDFEQRGAGDFLGVKQHGRGDSFAGVVVDTAMIKTAKSISEELLSDPVARSALANSAEGKSEFIKSLSLS